MGRKFEHFIEKMANSNRLIPKSRFARAREEPLTSDLKKSKLSHESIDDYMSSDFIELFKEKNSNKSKPVRSEVLEHVPLKQQMEEKLAQGLDTAIPATNKGFKLLQKYGYSGEGGLGKDSSGISKPLTIQLSDPKDKLGIGVAEEKRKKVAKYEEDMRKLTESRENMLKNFELRQSFDNQLRVMERDIKSAEKVIYEFDTRKSIPDNHLWPQHFQEMATDNLIESKKDTSLFVISRLQECLFYLRENYHYCLYCGCSYNDADDLDLNCPGMLEADH